jgi:phage tail-like protein
MAQLSASPQRFDPYRNFKFRVRLDGRYVAGASKMSASKRSTELVDHRAGGDSSTVRKAPGRTKFDAVTLERGTTHDTEFEKWATGFGLNTALADLRKDLIVEVCNEAGQLVHVYKLYRCWVSAFTAVPDLDANANAVAIESLKLECEGWERDGEAAEPAEPTFTESE